MAEEELVMVVTEGVVALVVTGELVILHMGVEEKLVILSTGEEEEEEEGTLRFQSASKEKSEKKERETTLMADYY